MTVPGGSVQILGIDAAVDPKNVGLAWAESNHKGAWTLTGVESGIRSGSLLKQVVDLVDPTRPILLAIDAPLGWPEPLARTLINHEAGSALNPSSEDLFARKTDRFVRHHTGLKPLDVGADRIARTARAALALIESIRRHTGQALPILLDISSASSGGLIEVYPAATLKQKALPCRGYKKQGATSSREEILRGISSSLDLGPHKAACLENDHCLDAVLCVTTAIDFLAGRCPRPDDQKSALSEGWIWFPMPQ
jgi:hypothetical protein